MRLKPSACAQLGGHTRPLEFRTRPAGKPYTLTCALWSLIGAIRAAQACEAFAAAAAVFADHASRADHRPSQPQGMAPQPNLDMGAGAFAALKAAHAHFSRASRHAYLVLSTYASAAAASPLLDYCAGFAGPPAR